jgi:cytoskeletal protein CcmA (bactofilin family)
MSQEFQGVTAHSGRASSEKRKEEAVDLFEGPTHIDSETAGESSTAEKQDTEGGKDMATMNPQSSDEAEEKVTTVIADDLHIKGTITFRSSLMIKGSLEGEIISEGLLVVGPTAKIGATIVTKSLVSHGEIKGDVTASDRVVLKGNSVQNGNITTPYIVVENGSTFNGSCVMKREKVAKPADETGGGEESGYEASGTETTAATEEVVEEAETAPAQESSPAFAQPETVAEEIPAPVETAREEEAPQAVESQPETAVSEETAQAAEGEEEARKSREDTGGESPLRSKWRRRELF